MYLHKNFQDSKTTTSFKKIIVFRRAGSTNDYNTDLFSTFLQIICFDQSLQQKIKTTEPKYNQPNYQIFPSKCEAFDILSSLLSNSNQKINENQCYYYHRILKYIVSLCSTLQIISVRRDGIIRGSNTNIYIIRIRKPETLIT